MNKAQRSTTRHSISIALLGSGGAGVMTAGQMLLDAAARSGYYGLMTRSVGPQIRGGEAAALLRLGTRPIRCQNDHIDLLVALDWDKAQRFAAELTLADDSLVLADPAQGDAPEWVAAGADRRLEVGFAALAKVAHRQARANTVAVGLVARMIGLDDGQVDQSVADMFQARAARLLDGVHAGLEAGREAAGELPAMPRLDAAPEDSTARWLVTGNEAVGFGALAGGVRFCAAYPITPSTEIQEWLAGRLPEVGGCLVQAEDELASINMCLGASFGGTPAMTATSGPGLSLMIEALGLATAAELPVVVVDVMRGGPSTGIPTKSEQADLNLAVFGAHGDAPRLVVAPNSIGDCAATTQWAVHLSEALQTPAIVLSDQLLGQARACIDRPPSKPWRAERRLAEDISAPYHRFADTDDGISPVALPGTPEGEHTLTGLTHRLDARPSAKVDDHHRQLDKRQRKLERFDYGAPWADIEGEGELSVLTFGSSTGAVREAAERLAAEGEHIRVISLRLLSPLDTAAMESLLAGCRRLLIVEQSHSGQFHHYLRSRLSLPAATRVFAQPGPLMITPGAIVDQVRALALEEAA